MKKPVLLLLFLLLFSCLAGLTSPLLALEVPYLTGRVTDNAQLLSAEARRNLSEQLKAHEEKTGNQVVVLTVPSLEGESIEGFAVRVFEDWKLGIKGKDNGVLIIVAPQDKRMRIEVGYGLEGVLTDLTAGRIIQQTMAPHFKAGDFDTGITAGALAVVQVLEGEALPAAAGTQQRSGGGLDGADLSVVERILIGAFVFGIIGLFTVIGILTPGVGWFLYLFLIPFWALFPVVVIGTQGALACLVVYLIGFPVMKLWLRNKAWYQKAQKDLRTKGSASIGGFTLMSGGGGGFSSGGFSGGGFSGGGGSSGGGGASGGW